MRKLTRAAVESRVRNLPRWAKALSAAVLIGGSILGVVGVDVVEGGLQLLEVDCPVAEDAER